MNEDGHLARHASETANDTVQAGKSRISVGMGQILVEGGRLEANLRRAEEAIREADRRGCHALVLPECLDAGWTHPSAREIARTIPGPTSDRLSAAARAAGVVVAAGITERDDDTIYNAAVLLSSDGDLLWKHRKINELDIGLDLYSVGDRLGVARTPLGTVGVNICADNFPGAVAFGESLARMGASLLLSPCAWAVDADHDNAADPYGGMWRESYGALARAWGMAVVGVSCVGWMTGGPWSGRKCIGCSLAVGRDGNMLAEGPYGVDAEAFVVVELPHASSSAQLAMQRA